MHYAVDVPLAAGEKTHTQIYRKLSGSVDNWLFDRGLKIVDAIQKAVISCLHQTFAKYYGDAEEITIATLKLDIYNSTGKTAYHVRVELSNTVQEKSSFFWLRQVTRRNILSEHTQIFYENHLPEKIKMAKTPYNVNIDCHNGEFSREDFNAYMSGIAAEARKLGYELEYPNSDSAMLQHLQFLANYNVPNGVISTRVFETSDKLHVGSILECNGGATPVADYLKTTGCYLPAHKASKPAGTLPIKPKVLSKAKSIECDKATNYADICAHVSKSSSELLAQAGSNLHFHGTEAGNVSAMAYVQLQSRLDCKPVLSVDLIPADTHLHHVGHEWMLRVTLSGININYSWDIAVRGVSYGMIP